MRLFSDFMIFFGAILLTLGTDLVVETAGQNLASVGGLLGVLVSLIGVSLLTAGLLSHARLSREGSDEEAAARAMKGNGRR
ncbi:MAG: hypothetical protein ACREQC_10940 [Candidatus Binataceae bacterium]